MVKELFCEDGNVKNADLVPRPIRTMLTSNIVSSNIMLLRMLLLLLLLVSRLLHMLE